MSRKISFVVPKNLQQELRERVIKDGYGLRGKSRWVSEAINSLLDLNDFPQLVKYGDEMQGFEGKESITIDDELVDKVDQAIIKIRQQFPTLEGVKSRLFRTAILQRLLR